MGDMYVVNFGDDDDRARRQTERAAENERLARRYVAHLVESADIDTGIAERVVTALFTNTYPDGSDCFCGCHPQLSSQHGDGFDCPCTWDDVRRAEQRARWDDWLNSPPARALAEHHEQEEREIAEWLTGQPDVEARRTSSFAPEQWEGTVDDRSFYFRERHGEWRIELDLEPTGRFLDKVVDVSDEELVTEPVPVREGTVIAEGVANQLGEAGVEHIAFIVRTIRDHIWAETCDHGALFYCPVCGRRMKGP